MIISSIGPKTLYDIDCIILAFGNMVQQGTTLLSKFVASGNVKERKISLSHEQRYITSTSTDTFTNNHIEQLRYSKHASILETSECIAYVFFFSL